MKTKTLWIDFVTHARKRTWQWKPWFIKSQIVYARGGKTWLAPHWEIGWGPLVFHWTGYDHEKEYTGAYQNEHECPADLMQVRINELENAIRIHRKETQSYSISDSDDALWEVLRDD